VLTPGPGADPDGHLATGWETHRPLSDGLVRRFVYAYASSFTSPVTLMGGRVVRREVVRDLGSCTHPPGSTTAPCCSSRCRTPVGSGRRRARGRSPHVGDRRGDPVQPLADTRPDRPRVAAQRPPTAAAAAVGRAGPTDPRTGWRSVRSRTPGRSATGSGSRSRATRSTSSQPGARGRFVDERILEDPRLHAWVAYVDGADRDRDLLRRPRAARPDVGRHAARPPRSRRVARPDAPPTRHLPRPAGDVPVLRPQPEAGTGPRVPPALPLDRVAVRPSGRTAILRSMNPAVQVRILGPLEVHRAGQPCAISSPLQRRLLTALTIAAGTTLAAEQLIDQLWGEDPPPAARNSLQSHVARLRGLIGADTILTRPPGYALDLACVAIDAVGSSEPSRTPAPSSRATRRGGLDPRDRPGRVAGRRARRVRRGSRPRRTHCGWRTCASMRAGSWPRPTN
jgi:hypothetical protein